MKTYFTIEELCQSDTAEMLQIDNYPPNEVLMNLHKLIEFLNPLREAWGSPIIITSGYRCPELNKQLGGSNTSVHKIGWAVDMIPQNGKLEEFKRFIIDYLQNNNLQWDQLLLEKSKYSLWVHLGLYNNCGKQRMQIKQMFT